VSIAGRIALCCVVLCCAVSAKHQGKQLQLKIIFCFVVALPSLAPCSWYPVIDTPSLLCVVAANTVKHCSLCPCVLQVQGRWR
jgi:hypothetical protein